MTEKRPPDSLKELDARIRDAEDRHHEVGRGKDSLERGGGLSLAFRIGVELVSALIVGVAIGLGLDKWLDTGPWFLLLFFVLGAAAGILNVFRTMSGYGYAAGYRKEARDNASQSGRDEERINEHGGDRRP